MAVGLIGKTLGGRAARVSRRHPGPPLSARTASTLAGWLAGWLVGWLSGWLTSLFACLFVLACMHFGWDKASQTDQPPSSFTSILTVEVIKPQAYLGGVSRESFQNARGSLWQTSGILCNTMPCYAMLSWAMLGLACLGFVLLRYAMLSCLMLCYGVLSCAIITIVIVTVIVIISSM